MNTLTWGQRVRRARKAAGLTLEDFSRTLDFSIPYLSELERGTRNALMDVRNNKIIADVCGVSATELLMCAWRERGFVPVDVVGSLMLRVIARGAVLDRVAPVSKESSEAFRQGFNKTMERLLSSGGVGE